MPDMDLTWRPCSAERAGPLQGPLTAGTHPRGCDRLACLGSSLYPDQIHAEISRPVVAFADFNSQVQTHGEEFAR